MKQTKQLIVGSSKGGVGKTMLALYSAVAAAKRGLKVCVVDLDSYGPTHWAGLSLTQEGVQSHLVEMRDLESWIGYQDEPEVPPAGLDQYLYEAKVRWAELDVTFTAVPLYPSTFVLARTNEMLSSRSGTTRVLQRLKALREVLKKKDFDWLIVDLAPGLFIGPAQLVRDSLADRTCTFLYVSTATDADVLTSIYDLDWIFSRAYGLEQETGPIWWVFNKVPEHRCLGRPDLQELLALLRSNLWEAARVQMDLNAMGGLARLLTTLPQDPSRIFNGRLARRVSAIPFDAEVASAMADTTLPGQSELWKRLNTCGIPLTNALESLAKALFEQEV